jgi:geranylgeranylglycerol-phosphate geranylgeranyltransferase
VPGSASGSDAAALLRLARPLNGALAGCAVLVGACVAGLEDGLRGAALGALAAFAAASGANALNDVVDRKADAVNRPRRPVASGRVGVRAALAAAVAACAVAVALGFAVSPSAGALSVAWVAGTALYSLAVKRVPLASNALAAAVAASPLVMGGVTQGRPGPTAAPFALAFLAHLAREIVKDVEDLEGDSAAGVRTIAATAGPSAALTVARLVVVALIAAAAVPLADRTYGWGYGAALVVADALLVRALVTAAPGADRAALGRASRLLKWAMAFGLLAFLLGTIL